jgi:hypothetical protein
MITATPPFDAEALQGSHHSHRLFVGRIPPEPQGRMRISMSGIVARRHLALHDMRSIRLDVIIAAQ